ncbi:MAG: hypothetical protein AAB538_00575 [Patescibacteria group bacterium]
MAKKKRRPFIVIEALDAGGSQTQTNALVKHLKREGYKPLQLHFPQEDRPTGQFIYGKFLNTHNQPNLSHREQALIYMQDFFSRQPDITAALRGPRESLIVSDRFYTSALAYQTKGLTGKARREMLDWITFLARGATPKLPEPDLVILLDTPPEVSLHHLRNEPKNYHESMSKLKAIRKSYLTLAREQKWAVVSSMTSQGKQRGVQDIHQEIWQRVEPIL